MELARPLEAAPAEKSPALTALRLQRKLTVEQAAKRSALWPEQVEWLEEGRLYRFPGYEAAVMALLRYATALGIDHREARKLSGMPVEPPAPRAFGRWIAAGAAAALVAVVSLALVLAFGRGGTSAAERRAASLAPPWNVAVDVLNGGGDINYTRRSPAASAPSATGSSTSRRRTGSTTRRLRSTSSPVARPSPRGSQPRSAAGRRARFPVATTLAASS